MDSTRTVQPDLPAYDQDLDPRQTVNETYDTFTLDLDDAKLNKMLIKNLDEDIAKWNNKPWLLETTDSENIKYWLGDQIDDKYLLPHQARYVDNRLGVAVRSILAYVTGQLAKPELLPSKPDDKYRRMASQMASGLYQHALDHKVNDEFRLSIRNLIMRKRGVMKLRYDRDYGPFGDILTENIDPADIVIDRYAQFGEDPNRVYHRQKCTIEELVAKFPNKKNEIFEFFSINRGTYSQVSRMVTYWECWFTYWDKDFKRKQGLAWFLPDSDIILDKVPNPNWIYGGDDQKDRIVNMTNQPIKPFVWLNYMNTGRSYIDETCLFDQASPMQDILNKRGRQIVENADYANPRVLVDKRIMDESDAKKFVNKSPKTIGLVDTTATGNNIQAGVQIIPASQLPSFVMQDKEDARAEIDTLFGINPQFRGQEASNPTLGQDKLQLAQAGNLQDDLVIMANQAMAKYYEYLVQMMKTYLPDDYWVMTKGDQGEYTHIQLNSSTIDTNVRIGIEVDSSLPLDKASQRATAMQLAQIPGRIDDLSLFEMLGLPDAEKLADRVQRYNLDRFTYMSSIEQGLFNAEAESDITLIENGKVPEDRDDYPEDYLNYWNLFISSNRFHKLPTQQQQALLMFLQAVSDKAALTEGLRSSMLNPAGIIDQPPQPPIPSKQIRIMGQLDPQQSAQAAGLGGPPPGAAKPGANAPAEAANRGGSNPKVQPPTQFGK